MRILMMTNTYAPIIGGIEESIRSFREEFIRLGHKVLVVAPEFEGSPKKEKGVARIPAIRNFSKTHYSVNLPVPGLLSRFVKIFRPDIVHSHHPFLVGDMALRLSRQYQIPLVFTYHIMFEEYIDYLPIHSDVFKRFVVELAAGYAKLCDRVIVPTQAVRQILQARGVTAPIGVIPTGIRPLQWAGGDGQGFRREYGIAPDAFVVGSVGRVSPEKNIEFLASSSARFLKTVERAHFLLIGDGPLAQGVRNIFQNAGVASRFHHAGVLRDKKLVDGYHAMDVFAFASHSETQGLVLLEAMAAGIPVVAVNAPAVEETVTDHKNGRLIGSDDTQDFVSALAWFASLPSGEIKKIRKAARQTVRRFSMDSCAKRMLEVYDDVKSHYVYPGGDHRVWSEVIHRFKGEMELLKNIMAAGETAMKETLRKKNHDRQNHELSAP